MLLSLLVLSPGCAERAPNDEETGVLAISAIPEGSPEALGVLAMLNARSTTFTLLDIDAALDKRAATNLIAHRDGADAAPGTSDDDLYDTIAEVDAVSYVGDSALAALLAYAQANGWVSPVDDTYGTIETVTFTDAEADAIVELANTASVTTLDVDVGLDSRAATNIVAGRTYATLEQVAAVKYVGAAALNDLKDWVDAEPATTLHTTDAVAALTADVSGLWYTSESDYPLLVWQIPSPSSTTLTIANVESVLASAYVARPDTLALADRAVEASTMSSMFDRYTVPQDWWEDTNRADAPKWQALRAVFDDQLESVTVWRFGRADRYSGLSGDIDVFVVGVTADGDLVGFSTVSIET